MHSPLTKPDSCENRSSRRKAFPAGRQSHGPASPRWNARSARVS